MDPLVDSTGQPYAYAGDDPINVSDPLGLRGWYCINGQTHYYSGNKYGATGNGRCGSALSRAISAYVTGKHEADAASAFLRSSWGHRARFVARNSAPIIIGAQVVGAVVTLGAAVPEEAALDAGGVTLFRAVGEAEAADIQATGSYRIAGSSAEFGKYFYPTQGQAEEFVARGWASQVTNAVFPRAAVEGADMISPATEGPALFVPAEWFPFGPVNFIGG